jgi:hypothetical protein
VSRFCAKLRPCIAVAIFLAIAGMFAGSWVAAAPLDVLRDCAERAAPDISGIKALSAACPQLQDALEALGLTQVQVDGWQARMNRATLKDLQSLAANYGGSRPGNGPGVGSLPGILESLANEQTPLKKSWWDVFKSWLAQHSDALDRLDRWLDHLRQSTTLFQAITYSLAAFVVLAAIAVILNELKANGAIRRERRRARAGKSGIQTVSAQSVEAEPVALADKLTALLRELVRRLTQTRRLNRDRSLTHRELVTRSAFDSESQRAVFATVAGAAESVVYGPDGATAEQLNAALLNGRSLLAQISNPPGTP